MKALFVIISAAVVLAGCQSPRTSYMNGVVVWCSGSAIGFGFGEYIEVPAGGKLNRATTNDTPCVWSNERAAINNAILIDNTAAPVDGKKAPCKCDPCKCDPCKCDPCKCGKREPSDKSEEPPPSIDEI